MTTHTYAILEVSTEVFNEIKDRFIEAKYFHALDTDYDGKVILIKIDSIALKVKGEKAKEFELRHL